MGDVYLMYDNRLIVCIAVLDLYIIPIYIYSYTYILINVYTQTDGHQEHHGLRLDQEGLLHLYTQHHTRRGRSYTSTQGPATV